jgi:1-acyl-sn-glycerol-3-phosphate acyltransferase
MAATPEPTKPKPQSAHSCDEQKSADNADAIADRTLRIIRALLIELDAKRARRLEINLDSTLDRDLGLDSLSRAELLMRLERSFGVRLPEGTLATADTPRALLDALLSATGRTPAAAPVSVRAAAPAEAAEAPPDARTLTDVLEWHVREHPDRTHLFLPDNAIETRSCTYRQLFDTSRAVAHGLRDAGIEPGDRVAIMLPTGSAFFQAFFGALYAGATPVPVYPPTRLTGIEEHLNRQVGILRNAGARCLITIQQALPLAGLVAAQVETLRIVETVEGLSRPSTDSLPGASAERLALLQYTSGSTGDPKGVMLSHANLLHNIHAMGQALDATSADVFVSWLPLYHDMGLIGAWLGSLYFAVPAVIMSPLQFLMRPENWLWAIHQHRGTLSAAPNFAFEHCLQNIEDRMIDGLDLSSLKVMVNGAEPVSADTMRRFTERFAAYGFAPEAMTPGYGLAECAVGLTLSSHHAAPGVDRIERRTLLDEGRAVSVPAAAPDTMEIVTCGQVLPEHELRIVDDAGRTLGERIEGRLQFRGPSATSGYFDDDAKTRALFDGDWLETGDLAYIADRELYVTGRSKDIIIRAGRNIHPHELEQAIGMIEGVRRGGVAVFGSSDTKTGTERLIVLAETGETTERRQTAMQHEIRSIAVDLLETAPDEIVLARPETVPKTPSGKVRRAMARQLYEEGTLEAPRRAVRWQILRFAIAGLLPRLWRQRQRVWRGLYTGYWWTIIGLLVAVVWVFVAVLPRQEWRWRVVRGSARLVLLLTGIPLDVEHPENLPDSGSVLVANHASYLDGIVLAAALPQELVFIAKEELSWKFFTGTMLRRLGTLFVTRWDPESGLRETKAAVARAREGRQIVFFPEGTFTPKSGLLPFHLGAFAVAARSGLPITPVTLQGTRWIMRGNQWMARRGRIRVVIGAAQYPKGADFGAAVTLRDAARAEILAHCGEPDLSEERVVFASPD